MTLHGEHWSFWQRALCLCNRGMSTEETRLRKSRRDVPAVLTSLVTCNWSADASPARSRLTPGRFRCWSPPVQARNLKHESIPESCFTDVGTAFNEGLAVVINGSYIGGMGITKRVDQRHVSVLKIDVGMVFYSLGYIFLEVCEIPIFKPSRSIRQFSPFTNDDKEITGGGRKSR